MSASRHIAWFLLACSAAAALAQPVPAPPEPAQPRRDADGVQRLDVLGGSYFFRPAHILAKAGEPLELSLSVAPGIVPHRFVLEGPDGQRLAELKLGTAPQTLRLTLKPGRYIYHCPNRLLGFAGHRERGMHGVLEVRE